MRLSTQLMLAMIGLVVLTAAIVGGLSYRNIEAMALPRALERIDTRARLLAAELEASVRSARADALGFRSAVAVEGIVRASTAGGQSVHDGISLADWRHRLASRFVAELAAKPNYMQFRIIGLADGGREIIRVERTSADAAIQIVPDEKLQQKGDRDYFQRAIQLKAGQVDVSPVELNQEGGGIELPPVPVIRSAASIDTPDGHPFGIVIINVDLRTAFAAVRTPAGPGPQSYVVNESGDYLVHPDPAKEFGFEFGKRVRIQEDFPDLSDLFGSTSVEPSILQARSGEKFAVASALVRLAGGPRIAIVHTVPESQLLAAATAVRNATLLAGALAAVVAITLAVGIARSLTRPLVQMTNAAEAFARGEIAKVPASGAGEIGTLARTFSRMVGDIQEKAASLHESAQVEHGIINTALDAFVQMDERGSVVEWNPRAEAVFGWSREEAVGKTLGELIIPPRHREAHTAGLERFLRTGETSVLGRHFEIEAIRRDGATIQVELTITALRRRQGFLFNGFIRDITERIKLARQLQQSQKMEALGLLVGGVAHDFNNLLTIVIGNHELLEAQITSDEQRDLLNRANTAAQMGSRLIERLLAFARQRPLASATVDLNDLVSGMAELLRRTLGETIVLKPTLQPSLWPTRTDPSEVENVVLNLALNARDAMPAGGTLILETRNVRIEQDGVTDVKPGDYVRLSVSDTGSGMPSEVVTKAFEPFFTTRPGTGSGLGLSVVYGFAKQSGGVATIYSEVGTGTTVNVYLPRTREGEAVATPQMAAAQGDTRRAGETILVVEDQPAVREVTVQRLKHLGYEVIIAADARVAIEILQSGIKVDLVFTDVIMPGGMTGIQLAEWMEQHAPETPVVLTSGFAADVARNGTNVGYMILRKPYGTSALSATIRNALDRRSKESTTRP